MCGWCWLVVDCVSVIVCICCCVSCMYMVVGWLLWCCVWFGNVCRLGIC